LRCGGAARLLLRGSSCCVAITVSVRWNPRAKAGAGHGWLYSAVCALLGIEGGYVWGLGGRWVAQGCAGPLAPPRGGAGAAAQFSVTASYDMQSIWGRAMRQVQKLKLSPTMRGGWVQNQNQMGPGAGRAGSRPTATALGPRKKIPSGDSSPLGARAT
jgi:hypothetical protein